MDFNTIETMLKTLRDNDGLTLKKSKPVTYKTGYQVASDGVEVRHILDAVAAIIKYNGNCGVWLSNGIYYIDNSHHIRTKKEAMTLGHEWNQLSIFDWKKSALIWM